MPKIEIPDDLFASLQAQADQIGVPVSVLVEQRLRATPPQEQSDAPQDTIAQLELAIQTAKLGIWQLDIATGVLTWNDELHEIYGISKDEFAANVNGWRDQVHPDDIAEADARFAEIISKGGVFNVRFRIIRPDGELRYLDASGSAIYDASGAVVRVIGVNWDRTPYERARQQHAESEARYRVLFENALNPIVVYDEAAQIVMLNHMAANFFGQAPEDLIGKSLAEFLPAHYDAVLGHIQQVLETGEPLYVADQIQFPDGDRWYWSVLQPVGGERDTGQVLVLSYDITERKQAEALRAEREELLATLERERHLAETRSNILAMISHEFRTPLAVIQSSYDLLTIYGDRLSESNRQQKLKNIQEQIKHLNNLLTEITSLTKAQRGFLAYDPVTVDIRAFCENLLDELRDTAHESHRLTFKADTASPTALFDPKLMHHALSNLIANAVKYSPDGGEVTLRAVEDQGALTFSVQDSGIGVPPTERDHIFKPFTRASNTGAIAGTGIGLSIVNEVARFHNGTVTLESEEGVGSTFYITIPHTP